jgi:glutaredoxin
MKMAARKATLYRMVLPDHVCPYGARAHALLEHAGFDIDEHILSTRMEVDAFLIEQNIETTPLVFIGSERIGGCEELERYLTSADTAA